VQISSHSFKRHQIQPPHQLDEASQRCKLVGLFWAPRKKKNKSALEKLREISRFSGKQQAALRKQQLDQFAPPIERRQARQQGRRRLSERKPILRRPNGGENWNLLSA